MSATRDLRSAGAARLHGERMGHLSRIGRADLLADEMAALADMAAGQINVHAFRKAFFGAGGTQEDWDKHGAQLMEAPAEPKAAAEPAPAAAAETAEPPAVEAVPEPVAAEPQPSEAEPEEPPWQELEAALAEEPEVEITPTEPGKPAAPAPKPEEAVAVQEGAPPCEISVTPLSGDKVAIVVRGTFGSAEYGGQDAAREIEQYLKTRPVDVVLDLRAVETLRVDSTAAIINCQMKARAYGHNLTIIRPRGSAAALLDAMGLSTRIECLAEEQAESMELPPLEE